MDDQDKTKKQLLAELAALRQQVGVLEQTEKSLRESEERYRTMVEVVPQMMAWMNADRETMQCNRRWYEYTGQTPAEARGFGWQKALHADDRGQVTRRINDSQASGEPFEAEYRVRRASDGAYRWHLARSLPMKDKDGTITGWFAGVTDIDDQKRAEMALRESEERFRKVFEEGPIGILLVDTDGRIQRANRRFCEMLGYAESELIAVGLAGVSHPDDWERDLPFVSRLWRGEISRYHLEKRYLRKDGQLVWCQVTISLMHDEAGRPINNIGMVEDITERRQAEERLQHSERTLRTLMDASPESIVLMGIDGRVVFANATMAQRFGTTADKLVGRTSADLLPAEIAANRMKHLQTVVRTGKSLRFDDVRFDRCIESALHPIFDEQGKVAALAVLGIDHTERRRAEEALQKAHDELERRVDERTSELTQANETLRREVEHRKQAEEALQREHRTLSYLLQSSDHERQTIAYEIHDGLAQYLAGALMQLDVYSHLKDTKPKDAAKAYDGGLTLLRQSHFEVRRLISGVRPPILDEEGVVAAIGHLVNEERRKKGPKIEYHSRVSFDRLTPILENAVYRVAQEALNNACKHSKSKTVKVELVQSGGQLRIEVQDRGVGFKPEDVEEGQFGLAGIRERARLLGGQAAVESEPGKGTRIVVELPIVLRQGESDAE
jgi:PAS domain S-box-containing protein